MPTVPALGADVISRMKQLALGRGLSKSCFYNWLKQCPSLGRPLRSVSDLELALGRRDQSPLDDFVEGTTKWLWVRLAVKEYGIGFKFVHRWEGKKCPALDGRIFQTKIRWFGNVRREYVREGDFKAVAAARGRNVDVGVAWVTYRQAREKFGWSRPFLEKYRSDQERPRPHPILGRTFKRKPCFDAAKMKWFLVFWQDDLEELKRKLSSPAHRPAWMSSVDAVSAFGFTHAQLCSLRPSLTAQKFPAVRSDGKSTLMRHYLRSELQEIREREQRITQRVGSRYHEDAEGRWLPNFEALQLVAESSPGSQFSPTTCHCNPCEELDGRHLRAKRIPVPPAWEHVRRQSAPRPWVFHEGDILQIAARKNGRPWPPPTHAPPTAITRAVTVVRDDELYLSPALVLDRIPLHGLSDKQKRNFLASLRERCKAWLKVDRKGTVTRIHVEDVALLRTHLLRHSLSKNNVSSAIGSVPRDPTPDELEKMKAEVREESLKKKRES